MSSGPRRTRTDLILKLISLLKAEELSNKQIFQQVELTALEAALKDDLGRHQWFNNLINTVVSEACPVSQEELDLYASSTASGVFKPAEYEDVKEEVQHLENNIKKLKHQMTFLEEKYSQLVRMKETEKETKLITAELRLKSALQEVQNFIDRDSIFNDPYENVAHLVTRSNEYFKEVSNLDRDRLLDSLALASYSNNKQDVLHHFLHHLGLLFVRVQDKLEKFKDHCNKLRVYFSVNLKKDILWRSEFKEFIDELDKCPVQHPSLIERPHSPKEILDTETCWATVEQIRLINQNYIDYTKKLNDFTEKIKTMIDFSLKR